MPFKQFSKTNNKILSLLILSMAFFVQSYAQEVKSHEKKSFQGKDGKLYWNKNTPAYIRLAMTPSDTGQLLKSSRAVDEAQPYYFDTEGENKIRTRWATDPDTHKPISPKVEEEWKVYADSKPPRSIVDFIGSPVFFTNNRQYYGNNLSIDIFGKDKLSGVDKTFYSVNGEDYKEFQEEIRIPNEGDYEIKYYSLDNVGNVEPPKSKTFSLDLTAPESAYTLTGGTYNNILSVSTKIHLNSVDTVAGISKILYSFDNGPEKLTKEGSSISISNLENGNHTINYYAVDNVDNKEEKKSFSFYLDKLAPILSSTIIGDQYVKEGKIYFSGRSMLKLTGVDDKSGLKEIQYSIDGKDFFAYDDPFFLPSVSGMHTVKYFAVDNMQNKTEVKRMIDAKYENYVFNEEKIYVDIKAPTVSYKFNGKNFVTRDTLFLSGNTKVVLGGKDSESGLGEITYTIDGETSKTYSGQLALSNLKSGFHTIEFIGYDNVRNNTKKKFSFILDNTPPELHYFYSVAPYSKRDGYNVYPEFMNIFLGATDITTGTKNIWYKVNNGKEQKYTGTISGFKKNILNTVIIRTQDNLGNETSEEVQFYVQ